VFEGWGTNQTCPCEEVEIILVAIALAACVLLSVIAYTPFEWEAAHPDQDGPFTVITRDSFRKTQLLTGAATTGSSRLQLDNPGAPSANAPRVAGAELGEIADAEESPSTGPVVAPAMMALPGVDS
jgi:hypothetical protein